jgi:predicted acylesterase/phospholipase RssA
LTSSILLLWWRQPDMKQQWNMKHELHGKHAVSALEHGRPVMVLTSVLYLVLAVVQALIWSAVAASSAFPGLFHPQDLLARNARGEEVR